MIDIGEWAEQEGGHLSPLGGATHSKLIFSAVAAWGCDDPITFQNTATLEVSGEAETRLGLNSTHPDPGPQSQSGYFLTSHTKDW